MDVLYQKQWVEKYKLCGRFFFRFFFRFFRKIKYCFLKNYFSKNGQRLPVYLLDGFFPPRCQSWRTPEWRFDISYLKKLLSTAFTYCRHCIGRIYIKGYLYPISYPKIAPILFLSGIC
jgi:hypothetical protein